MVQRRRRRLGYTESAVDCCPNILHLSELATVGMLGFAARVKGWRDVGLTAWKQTQIESDTATGQVGGMLPWSEVSSRPVGQAANRKGRRIPRLKGAAGGHASPQKPAARIGTLEFRDSRARLADTQVPRSLRLGSANLNPETQGRGWRKHKSPEACDSDVTRRNSETQGRGWRTCKSPSTSLPVQARMHTGPQRP